jgi:hypothetical protein
MTLLLKKIRQEWIERIFKNRLFAKSILKTELQKLIPFLEHAPPFNKLMMGLNIF